MSQLTDQRSLLETCNMRIVQTGSKHGWPVGKDLYIQCPRCKYYVSTTQYDQCTCGCIAVDVDYARISVCRDQPESAVAVCVAEPKNKSSWLSVILDVLNLFGK